MRILITGASGTGTTTLGGALATETGWHFFDADDYYWIPSDPPYTHKQEPAVRLRTLLRDLSHSHSAIVAGSIMNWGRELEESFSLIVFLTIPAAVRIARLRERELARFGRVNPAFLAWAAQYEEGSLAGRSLQRHEEWLAQRRSPVLRIAGDTSTDDRLAAIRPHIGAGVPVDIIRSGQ